MGQTWEHSSHEVTQTAGGRRGGVASALPMNPEWDSQSTWPTSFMLNMHITKRLLPLPCCIPLLTMWSRVGQSYRSHVVCESVTALPPALFTLQLQQYHRDKIFEETHKLTLLVLVWKLRQLIAHHRNFTWHFWHKTNISRSLVLLLLAGQALPPAPHTKAT